ncbi:MAG: gluconate 2-dehydrogenase subunit 3 family protein [Geminicoccaceae bacterium]|nr:gluconate 2-dehydrogenase subunit 3 family protein [Geminicoccaceae bacterium]
MKRILDRRLFLRTAAQAAATVATVGGATVIAASNGAWAMTLSAFDAATARVLLVMTRDLYPHDMLGDVYYAEVVESLDKKAKADPRLAEAIREGVAALDRATGVPWLQLSPGGRLEVLKAMETSPFFQTVKGETLVGLYNNKLVWHHFGYQGSSAEFGGYLHRGFQDAGWTMQPDAEASPPPPA